MYGLKNLVPKGVLCDDNYTVLRKRSQEYRRSLGYFILHIQQMNKIYIDYYEQLQVSTTQARSQMNEEMTIVLFSQTLKIFKCVNGELRKFIERVAVNQRSLVQVNNLFMTDYNLLIANFQSKAREYFADEQNVVDTCKKYFKAYEQMLEKIEAYKVSFMDVKLIYNTDEKIKRYNDCLLNYQKLQQLSHLIYLKVDELNITKAALVESYQILQKQLSNFTTSFASRYIEELKKFYECLFDLQRNKLQLLINKLAFIDKLPLPPIFIHPNNTDNQEFIATAIINDDCRLLPSFVVYREQLNHQGRQYFWKCFLVYQYDIMKRAQDRKKASRSILDFLNTYIKNLDKILISSYKETFQSFEKMRKKIGQAFGSRWISFYKIIAAIFENSIQNIGRLTLRLESKIKTIENSISQENRLMDDFIREMRRFSENKIPKKVLKKYNADKQGKQKKDILEQQKTITEENILQGSEFITKLVYKCSEVLQRNSDKLRDGFIGVITDLKQSMAQYFTYFNEVRQIYYDEEEYAKSYKSFQQEMTESVKNCMQFFLEIQLSAIVKENQKITFDSEFHKIQGFKKIKKPKELEQGKQIQSDNSMNMLSGFSNVSKIEAYRSRPEDGKLDVTGENISVMLSKQIFCGEIKSKNAEFLLQKMTPEANEKYVKSYSCSLSDTIILAGRLYITNYRLFFHSGFNAKNIFFGETFIQIPKKDLLKVEKRSMSFLSDRAISITTINGQLNFRSFFSRDATYELIKKIFQVNSDEIFFEEEEHEENGLLEKQLQFEDDMKEESGKVREQKLIKGIKQFQYKILGEEQFTFFGLTVVKFLKIFELSQQVTVNRTNFPSFLHYYKDVLQHKEIDIQAWNPNPLQFINVINLKQDSPEVYNRRVSAVVPLPPSNIPFMPKTCLTVENQTMFLINKDKIVFQSIVNNSGVPYCQAFDIRFKRIIETAGQNKVKMSAFLFVNFNQNVMVKATIESKTIETAKQNHASQCEQINNYFKILEKKMLKGNKKESPEEKIKEQAELIEELEKQLKKYKQISKQTTIQMSKATTKVKRLAITTIIFFLLTIIQCVLLLN